MMNLQNRLEYILFIGLSYFTKLLGLRLSRGFAKGLAYVFYFIIPIRKDVTIKNLKMAFPNYSEEKIKKIAIGTYKSFAITLIETLYIPHISKTEMINSLKCFNLDLLNKKIEEKKATVILSAHFGNWEYLSASLALQLNYPLNMLIKVQRNPYVTEFMDKARTKWSNVVIPLGTAVRQIFKALYENEIIIMAADQRGNVDGIRIEFLGISSAVYSGPAVFALKTNADIIIAISVRQPDYSYKVEIAELPLNDLPDNNDAKVEEICRRYLNFLEKLIRQYPEQWLWMHKRWKH